MATNIKHKHKHRHKKYHEIKHTHTHYMATSTFEIWIIPSLAYFEYPRNNNSIIATISYAYRIRGLVSEQSNTRSSLLAEPPPAPPRARASEGIGAPKI